MGWMGQLACPVWQDMQQLTLWLAAIRCLYSVCGRCCDRHTSQLVMYGSDSSCL
jgi:hypothetical protein